MTSVFTELMAIRGDEAPPPESVRITGNDPVLSTRFKIGETCAHVLAGVGVAVSDIWESKTGRRQEAAIDVRAAAAALRSSYHMRVSDGTGRVSRCQQPGASGRAGHDPAMADQGRALVSAALRPAQPA